MTDLVPTNDDDETVDPALDMYLRAENVIAAINANLPAGAAQLTPIPKNYVFKRRDREVVSVAMHTAFELIGGVPAFSLWAQTNPEKFYNMWSKLLPSNTETAAGGTTIQFISPIPSNPLDNVSIDSTGRVISIDSDDGMPE